MAERWEPPPTLEEYRLVRRLGRGAMGEVWLAHDTLLDRPVAIKFIIGERATEHSQIRFLIEARAIARLDHPNVIRIHRVGELDGRPFLVSEYLHGQSLDRIAKPIALGAVQEIALGLARGLATAHRRGVLHRDVKPANVFQTQGGQIKLLDFGLAKVVDSTELVNEVPAGVVQPTSPLAKTLASSPAHELTLPAESARVAPAVRVAAEPLPVAPERDVTLPGDPITGGPSAASSGKSPPASKSSGKRSSGPLPSRDGSTERDASGRRNGQSPAATLAGVLMGTPSYMAPELWGGEAATMQSDVYALGATLFELITGRPPHEATSLSMLAYMAHSRDVAAIRTLRPDLPAALARVIDRCLLRDPTQRLASAEAVSAELEAATREASAGELPAGNPYRGLNAYDEHHKRLFFGRDREITEIIDRLRSESWLVVAGRSGAGKSSIVRAGVIPRVRDRALDEPGASATWRVITMTPGERPLAALATAAAAALERDSTALETTLRDDPSHLLRELRADREHRTLLVIDQLEELVTLADGEERARFVDAIAPALVLTPQLRVIATIRSDFVGQLDATPTLARTLGRALYLLGPLERDGIRAAVTAPAKAHGFQFESEDDVEALVGAVTDHPGALPLLAFALAQLWELRDEGKCIIPSTALSTIGGVAGALAKHADAVLSILSDEGRAMARTILLRLISADRTRARRTKKELLGDEQRTLDRTALDALVQGRLLVVEDSDRGVTYELAHEALLTHWTRLRVWLDEEDVDHATRERIELAAADWERQGRPGDALWTGPRIVAIGDVSLDQLTTTGREFVVQGRLARQTVQRRRTALVFGAITVLASFLVVALWLNHRAGVARDRAQANAAAAQARSAALYQEHGRQALIAGDPMRAAAYLAEAFSAGQRGPELQFLLDRTSNALEGTVARMAGHTDQVFGLDWSSDNKRILTSSRDGTVRVWNTGDGSAIATMRGHSDLILEAWFSPDGKRVASASFDGTAAIWDARSGERLHLFSGHTGKVFSIAWFADGNRVVTGSLDGTAKVWDANSGTLLGTLEHGDKLAFARVNPTGDRIITGAGIAILWDATTYKQVARLEGHRAVVWRAAFSPDGRRVVTASDDTTAKVWDATTGALISTFAEHTDKISHVTFSPEGEVVATASEDGTARVWSPTKGESILALRHDAPVWHVAFSPDGSHMVTGSADGTAALWTSRHGTRLWTYVGHTAAVWRARFSHDGQHIATVSWDRTARVWDAARSVQRLGLFGHRGAVYDAQLAPTTDRILTIVGDGELRMWDGAGQQVPWQAETKDTDQLESRFVRWAANGAWFVIVRRNAVERRDAATGNLIRSFPTKAQAHLAKPSRRGHRLAITDGNDVQIVDTERGDVVQVLRGHSAAVVTTDWSADDATLLTASEDKTVRLWDVASGKQVASMERAGSLIGAWFSSDGKRFAAAAVDRSLAIWDTATRTIVASCEGESSGFVEAAFSPDGAFLVSGSSDGAVKVWSAESGRLLSVIGRHRTSLTTVSFHSDGRQVLSAGLDRTARVWTVANRVDDLGLLVSQLRCRTPYHIERGLIASGTPSACMQ